MSSAGGDNNNEASQWHWLWRSKNSVRRQRNVSQKESCCSRDKEHYNCASIPRTHRIAPMPKCLTNNKEIKNKTKSEIKFPFRPIPGRSFDGFLGRFTKRRGGGQGITPNRKPTPMTSAAALKHKFRASCKVSPVRLLPSLDRESIVLHDPDPLMHDNAVAAETSKTSIDLCKHHDQANLSHTIKIYLHGSSSSISGESDQRPCQLLQSDRSEKFSLGSTRNSVLRDSVNTSLSIFCSAAGGKPITEVARVPPPPPLPVESDQPKGTESMDNGVKTSTRSTTEFESMTSPTPTTTTTDNYEDVEAILESIQDPNDTVDLDTEFREVLHFNIGESIRTPLALRGHLRHVTSLESSDEETTTGALSGTRSGSDCEESTSAVNTRSKRLIQFHNLQDSTGGGEDDNDNVRPESRPNELFQSLNEEQNCYSGSGVSTNLQSVGGGMPAHGDLLFIDQGSDTFQPAPKMSTTVGKKEHLYKILVIGDLGTGKTSFIKRYVHQFFSSNYRATIGVDFALKVIPWDESTLVRLQLWDIAGQERFGNMTRVYYKEAVGAFIVFDVTRQATFDAVKKWKQDLDGKVQLPDGSNIPCMLLANKCDQEKQGFCADSSKMDEFVKENDFIGWFETSAKDNINIDESAKGLVGQILLNDRKIALDEVDGEKITLEPQAAPADSKKCSC